jgi:class 3 adenylate cyclase
LEAIAALRAETTAPAAAAVSPAAAERRQLTVTFCDLVGSTALSRRIDREDLREVIGAHQRCVAETIGHSDGFVAKYLGDGVLAYFGYPQDDAERAIRAALALVEEIGRSGAAEALRLRVGIATGLVIVGDLIFSNIATSARRR